MKVGLDVKNKAAYLVEKSGISVNAMAAKIGTSYSTLWNFLYGETRNFGKIQELADQLHLTLYQLTTESLEDSSARLMSAADRARAQPQTLPERIPVYQTDPSETIHMEAHEVAEHASRMIGEGVSKLFAVRVKGDTMSPRYYWGEILYCAQNIWPKPGDDCIVELNNGTGYLKIYAGEKDGDYVVRQLNPAKEGRYPKAEVKALHTVIARG